MIPERMVFKLYWQDKKTLQQIGQQYGVSATAVWKRMKRLQLDRRSMSEAMFNRYNPVPAFRIINGFSGKKPLWWVGTSLYWCEGTHRDKVGKEPSTVTFTNANTHALQIWLKFLITGCYLQEEKVRIRLYLHPDQNERALRHYWSRTLGVPLRQFEQTTWTKKKRSKRNHSGYLGTVKIKVHSKRLVQQLKIWVQDLQEQFLGRGV